MFESAITTIYEANNTLTYDIHEMATISVLFVLGVLGTLGSGAILFSSFFFQQSPHGIIILSLCLADLLSSLNVLIASTGNIIRGGLLPGTLGLEKCMIEAFVEMVAYSVSVVSLCLVAAERYFAVFYGLADHSRRVVFVVIIVWIYAIGYASTTLTSGSNFRIATGRMTCTTLCSNSFMFPLCILAGVSATLGSGIATFCYWKLFKFYQDSNSRRKQSKRDAKEKKLLRKFTVIILFFIIMAFPFMLTFLYEAISGNPVFATMGHIATILLSSNATLNPYILYFMDSAIKQQVDRVFKLGPMLTQLSVSTSSLALQVRSGTNPTPTTSKFAQRAETPVESLAQTALM